MELPPTTRRVISFPTPEEAQEIRERKARQKKAAWAREIIRRSEMTPEEHRLEALRNGE